MKAITKFLAGGVAIAALATAAPAAAQYYPGYGNPVGQVINQVFGGGYGQGVNSQAVVNQCANAVQMRLSGNRYGGGYGGYSGYGGYASPYGVAGGGRVLGISRVEQRSGGGLTVRGVANSGQQAGYGYAYAQQPRVDLTWKCKTNYRGQITEVDIDRAQTNYGYGQNYAPNYTPWGNDYSQYGYRRY